MVKNVMKRLFLVLVAAHFLAAVFAAETEFAQGKRLFETHHAKEAVPHLNNALAEPNPDPDTYLYLGLAYYELKDYQKSLEIFRSGLSVSDADRKILAYNGANSAYSLKNYGLALELYNEALEQDENFTKAILNRANTSLLLQNLEPALSDYEKYVLLEPDSPQIETINLLIEKIKEQIAEDKASNRALKIEQDAWPDTPLLLVEGKAATAGESVSYGQGDDFTRYSEPDVPPAPPPVEALQVPAQLLEPETPPVAPESIGEAEAPPPVAPESEPESIAEPKALGAIPDDEA